MTRTPRRAKLDHISPAWHRLARERFDHVSAEVYGMDYELRIARQRPQGGMDTLIESIDARSVERAIDCAAHLMGAFLLGQPGVAILTSITSGGIVWTYRQDLPAPPPFRSLPR